MKLKFWQFEYDFDKEDAKIVIPIILLALGLGVTNFNKELLLSLAAAYYILHFYLAICIKTTSSVLSKVFFRCPYCKGHEMLFNTVVWISDIGGYDSYICNLCGKKSIHINTPLMSKFVKMDGSEKKISEHIKTEDETKSPF
jgi:DNA-directed RNA polymerase subunit RPC12/RpoP